LTAVYGEYEAQNIFGGGMSNKLFYGGLDLQTCQYLEKMLGVYTEQDTMSGTWGQIRGFSKPLMRNDEIRMLGDEQAILISGNKKPILFDMLPYYKSKLNKLAEKEALKLDCNLDEGKPKKLASFNVSSSRPEGGC